MDWAHAADHMRALRLIAGVTSPGDFVVASGQLNSVRDFGTYVFDCLGLNFDTYVDEDPTLIRSMNRRTELVGNSKKLRDMTGWEPRFSLQELARDMVEAELAKLGKFMRVRCLLLAFTGENFGCGFLLLLFWPTERA